MRARLPSSPVIAELRSCEIVPIHSLADEILNELARLGSNVSTSDRANGKSVGPIARNLWPKAYILS